MELLPATTKEEIEVSRTNILNTILTYSKITRMEEKEEEIDALRNTERGKEKATEKIIGEKGERER